MVLGTLRDQLLYPYNEEREAEQEANGSGSESKSAPTATNGSAGGDVDDAFLETVLRDVMLGDLLDRCEAEAPDACGLDAEMDWSSTLSLGEQQRLAFARLLVNKPDLAILDESTSALDVQTEEQMYVLLKRFGISYLSVGHRPTLLKYHRSVLQLKREGGSYSASLMDASDVDMETYLMNTT